MFFNKSQYKTFKKFPDYLKQSLLDHDEVYGSGKKHIPQYSDNDYHIHPNLWTTKDTTQDEMRLIFEDIHAYYNLSYIDVANILIILLTPNKIKNIPEGQYIKELEVAHDFSLFFKYYHKDCCNITSIKTEYCESNIEAFLYVLYKTFFSEYDKHIETITTNTPTLEHRLCYDLFRDVVVNKEFVNYYNKIDRIKNDVMNNNSSFFNSIVELYIKNDNIRYYLTSIMRNTIKMNDYNVPSYALVIYRYIFLGINEKIQKDKSDEVCYAYNYCLEKIITDIAERDMKELTSIVIFTTKDFRSENKHINTNHINNILLQTNYIMDNYRLLKNKNRFGNMNFIDYFTSLTVNILGILFYNEKENKTVIELEDFIQNCPEELFSKLFHNYDYVNKLIQLGNPSEIFQKRWNKLKLKYNP